MASEAQIKAQKKYDAKNTMQVHLKLNRRTDEDVLEKLDSECPSSEGCPVREDCEAVRA